MPSCKVCKGYGLVRRTFYCQNCGGRTCYLCENVNKNWEECGECLLKVKPPSDNIKRKENN